VSAHFSHPQSAAEASEPQKAVEEQAGPALLPTNGALPFDPQQPLREYAAPAAWPPPVVAAMPPRPAYPFEPGYMPADWYPGFAGPYPGSTRPVLPPRPARDTYILVVRIVACIGSCLALLGGLGCVVLLLLVSIEQAAGLLAFSNGQYFSSMMEGLALAAAGLIGGSFCFYHSLRALFFKQPSRRIWLPRFWVFLLCYLATLGLGLWLHMLGRDMASSLGLGLLITLAGVFPALTILALGAGRLRFPGTGIWPTTWRRLVLALVSGATLSIALASVLELVFWLLLVGIHSGGILQLLNTPASSDDPLFGILIVLAAVIAPLVEELVKPLGVLVLIGRVSSKAEAFTLGLACGIGFNLIETTGYISQGYSDWLNVALGRSGAGLLHGFGAAMMALGWYILTHPQEGSWRRRSWLALGCGGYAVVQHALWNGSIALVLLPGAPGAFFQTWSWNLGPVYIDGYELVNIAQGVLILAFFLTMARRLRVRPASAPPAQPPIALSQT
jgi:hypothetical protein